MKALCPPILYYLGQTAGVLWGHDVQARHGRVGELFLQLTESIYTIARTKLEIDVLTEWRRRRLRPSTDEIDYGEFVTDLRTILDATRAPIPSGYMERLDLMCDSMYVIDIMTTDLLVNDLLPQYWFATGRLRHLDFYLSEEWLPAATLETYVNDIYV